MKLFEDIDLHANVIGYFKMALAGVITDPTAKHCLMYLKNLRNQGN